MSTVNEYIKTVIGISILSGIISVIAPSGSNSKVLRFVCGIFVLLCLMRPLNESISAIKDFKFDFQNEYTFSDTKNYTYELIENEMKSQLNACVKQVTGESAENISVTVQGDDENIEIAFVEITVNSAYIHKIQALKEVVYSKFGITPSVIT